MESSHSLRHEMELSVRLLMTEMGGKRPLAAARKCLIPDFHPDVESSGSIDQGRDVPRIQLAVEANAHYPGAVPSDYRTTAKRSTVQNHGGSGWQACRTVQLRATGRQVEEPDSMALFIGLQKRR